MWSTCTMADVYHSLKSMLACRLRLDWGTHLLELPNAASAFFSSYTNHGTWLIVNRDMCKRREKKCWMSGRCCGRHYLQIPSSCPSMMSSIMLFFIYLLNYIRAQFLWVHFLLLKLMSHFRLSCIPWWKAENDTVLLLHPIVEDSKVVLRKLLPKLICWCNLKKKILVFIT